MKKRALVTDVTALFFVGMMFFIAVTGPFIVAIVLVIAVPVPFIAVTAAKP